MTDFSEYKFKFKYDYAKLPRKDVHTTINNELYLQFSNLCKTFNQPTSKAYDVLLMMMLQSEESKQAFIKKLKEY